MTNKEIGEMIRTRREARGMTQVQLAIAAGISPSAVGMYERGERTPKGEIVTALADVFNVPRWAILYREDEVRPVANNLVPISEMPHHKVPLIGSVAAGQPILAEEEYDVYIDAPGKADYALKVQGDSMKPNYLDGDIVYIKQQPDVNDGQVAVVLCDDSATLKHVYHQSNGLLLISDNHDYAPMSITFEDYNTIRVLGVPCGFTRMYAPQKGKVTKGFHS